MSNICVISLEFPPEPGGIGEYAYQTALKLSDAGHSILTIIAHNYTSKEEFNSFQKSHKFKIKRITGYNGRTFFLLKKILLFKKLLLAHETDLIIVVSDTVGLIARILKKLTNIPYVIIGHGSEFLPTNVAHKMLIKFCFDGASFILLNSKYTLSLIKKHTSIKNKSIKLLYPGADEVLFDPEKYKNDKNLYEKKVLLSVGALSIRKGHKQVLDALKFLKSKNLDFEFWIVGKGSEKENLIKYIEYLELTENVKLFGFVPREDLPSYYNKCDLFVLASNDLDATQVEGFGIVLVEANLMKKPLIGSKDSGMEEIIVDGFNGLLANSKDPEDLAEKIEAILFNDELASKMGENGYNRAIENFVWSKFGSELNKLILDSFSNLGNK